MIFSGKKTKIHSNCLTSFYRSYHAFTEHVIFSHDRDHDMFIYCSTFSLMTLYRLVYSGLATTLHHLSWRCHCKCFPFHYFPRLEFPLFPDWKFPAAELLAAQSISQTDVPLKRRKKGLSLALCGTDDPIKQSGSKCCLRFMTHNMPTFSQHWLNMLSWVKLVPVSAKRQHNRKSSYLHWYEPYAHLGTCLCLFHGAEKC